MSDPKAPSEPTPGVEEAHATFEAAIDDPRLDTPEQRRARVLRIAEDFMDRHDDAFRALAR